MHVNCTEMNLGYKAMNKVCAKTRSTFKGILHLILAFLSLKNNSAFVIVECLEQTAVATSISFLMNGEKLGGGMQRLYKIYICYSALASNRLKCFCMQCVQGF